MGEVKKSNEPRDYKERFEFVLTTGNNIICQRYFRIYNFNPISLRSYELTSALRKCVSVIDRDLKDKTQIYLEMYAPMCFDTVEQMNAFLSNPDKYKELHVGGGLVVRSNSESDYAYIGDGKVKELGFKFDDGELTTVDVENTKTTYKFAFKVDGREVSSVIWDGYYPRFVRDKIDLSNKRGKFEETDLSRLSFEQYLLYMMFKDKSDLVWGLIKTICSACCNTDDDSYTTSPDKIIENYDKDSIELFHNKEYKLM